MPAYADGEIVGGFKRQPEICHVRHLIFVRVQVRSGRQRSSALLTFGSRSFAKNGGIAAFYVA
jgi:hypothetical protein